MFYDIWKSQSLSIQKVIYFKFIQDSIEKKIIAYYWYKKVL